MSPRAPARTLGSKWDAARLVFRRGGLSTFLERALRRGLAPLGAWYTLVFFSRELAEEMPEIQARLPLEMHVVGAGELAPFRALLEGAGQDWAEVNVRAARGDRCTIAVSEGRLVHVRWLSTTVGLIPEIGGSLRPGDGEAYVYAAFTPPEARGSRVQPAVSPLMLRWARAQGLRRHLFYVRGDNASALAIVNKVGARRTRTVRCLRFRGGGLWVAGLGGGPGPRIEFPPGVRLRSLGPFGWWIA